MRVNFPFSNVSTVQSVVTASRASTALFLSASVSSSVNALFPKGPDGAAGPTLDVNGIEGPPGTFGPTGATGLDALLLNDTRAKCKGECYFVNNTDPSSVLVAWTDLTGTGASDNLAAFSTTYICSTTLPVSTATVTPCGSPCIELVTNIAEADNIPCDC